jgi:hypothetical protein
MATHPEDSRDPEETREPQPEASGKPDEPEAPEPVVQGPGGTPSDSDSAIELGLPAGSGDILSDSDLHPPAAEPPASSGVAWAALMEELPEVPPDDLRLDAAPVADALAPTESAFVAPPPASEPTASGIGDMPDVSAVESTVQPGRPQTQGGSTEPPPAAPSGDLGRVDLGAVAPPAASAGPESSIVDLGTLDYPRGDGSSGAVEVVELASGASGVELIAEPVSGIGSSRDLIAEALESGIKLDAPEASDPGAAASPMESAIDFAHPATSPESATGAAGMPHSSAVDYGGPRPPGAAPLSSAIEFGGPPQRPATPPASSAIEFGGQAPARPTPSPERPPTESPAGTGSPTGSAVSSSVDYGGEPSAPEDSSSAVRLAPDESDQGAFEVRPPTLHPDSGRPATQHSTGDRPPTLHSEGGRPATLPDVAGGEPRRGKRAGPTESEIDFDAQPGASEFEALGGLDESGTAKGGADSDMDIDIGELPEGAEAAGSGLFDKANSGRLEPTDASIDLEAAPEDETEVGVAPVPEVEESETALEPPTGKVPTRAGGRVAWLGGAGIGAVVGSAAVVLLQLLGIGAGTSSTPPKATAPATQPAPVAANPVPAPPVPAAAAPAGPAVSKFDLLRSGDLDKAAQAGIEQVDENSAEQLARRGEYRWLAYLQKQHRGKAPLNAEDKAVKDAAADLQAAAAKDNTEALFWLGHLQEVMGAADKAKATFTKGATAAKDPLQKRRFEAALRRLELRQPVPAGAARGPDAAEALLLALVALQGTPPAPAEDGDEAGFAFWDAAGLARDGRFADAVKALDTARALHDQRRFTRLRKAQNPLSDPMEEVFLRCADEVKTYWQLQDKLRSNGYQGLDDVVAKAKEAEAARAQADMLAKQVEAETKKAEAMLKDADAKAKAALAAAEKGTAAEAEKLKAAEERAKSEGAKLAAVEARERELAAAKAADEAELKAITDELVKAKLLEPNAGRDNLLRGLQSAVKLASTADSQGVLRGLQNEANRFREQLGQRWRPNEMLTYWLPILRDHSRTDLAAKAALDAARVVKEADASPTDKARADAVLGLALRIQGKMAEAKAALERARAGLPAADAEWRERVEAALKDVADPAGYFLSRAAELQRQGRADQAVAELDKAEKANPAGAARFQAQRALLRLDAAPARPDGRPGPNDAALRAARRDADEAARSGDAFALYAAGRVAEEAGDYATAVANYRKAVAAHPARDAEGSRYRIALARVLMRAGAPEAPGQPAAPGDSTGRSTPAAEAVLVALGVLLQGPPSPAGQQEATELADEVLASSDSTPEMRAQALAIKGMYTQALLTYADALRPVLTREQLATLKELIQSHPALRRPETLAVQDPQEAERRYATGLRLLYSGRYAAAEKELLAAVAQDGQDARYYYFLGLARLNQGKRDAYEDFEQGARLEQQGLPPSEAVNSALERVQGEARRTIDNARGVPR